MTGLKLEQNGQILFGQSNATPAQPDQGYVSLYSQSDQIKCINSSGVISVFGTSGTSGSNAPAGLIPSATTAAILAITSPVEGMIRYSTDDQVLAFYNGADWIKLQNNGNL
jgi:hypothetical protein